MILPLVLGAILAIVGVACSPSKNEGNGFRMGMRATDVEGAQLYISPDYWRVVFFDKVRYNISNVINFYSNLG